EQRNHQERSEKAVKNKWKRQLKDDSGSQIIHLQRPEVAEVILGLVEKLQDIRNREGEDYLHKHHDTGADDLVAIVFVFADHVDAAGHHRDRVQQAVQCPLASQPDGAGGSRENFRVVQDDVESEQHSAQQPGGDAAIGNVVRQPVELSRLNHGS